MGLNLAFCAQESEETPRGDGTQHVPDGMSLDQRIGPAPLVLVGAGGTVLESRDGGLSFGTLGIAGRSARNAVAENAAGDLVLAGFGGVRVIGKGDDQ